MRPIDGDALYHAFETVYGEPNPLLGEMAWWFFDKLEEAPAISPPPNDPLTLEELREMDGEPVWVCKPNGANSVWGLVDFEHQMVRLHGGGLAVFENLRKTWLAYRRKPEEES